MAEIRPGVYVTTGKANKAETADVQQGTVAALFRGDWGPIGTVQSVGSLEELQALYGSGGRVAVAAEALNAGARELLCCRLDGAGEAAASITLKDTATTAADVVTLTAKYPGVRGNSFNVTVRDSLSDANSRELLVHEGTTLRETVAFAKGGTGEVDAIVTAVIANSSWLAANKVAAGTGLLAAITTQSLAGGVDPTVVAQSYTDALAAIEAEEWNVLATDNEEGSISTAVATYVDRVRSENKRVIGVVAEPTSVAFATRCTNAAAFNSEGIVYVGNGFRKSDGVSYQGYLAAGRVAGMIASSDVPSSLTHAVIPSATGLVGGLTNSQIKAAIEAGMLVFSLNRSNQVQVEYGINTLVTPSGNQDNGWKKIRRVRTRDHLIERIIASWEPLIGKVNNSNDGRATLVAAAQGIVNEMVGQGALESGTVTEDPAHTADGDSAWFLASVVDLDSAEKIYITLSFEY